MNSMSGSRASESSAPGMTTEAPWSPPMASSAMRTLCGIDGPYRPGRRRLPQARSCGSNCATIAFRRKIQQGALPSSPGIAAAPSSPQACQRRKWMVALGFGGRRLEHRSGLARIGIDSQDQEFDRHRAEVDGIAVKELRRVLGRHLHAPAFAGRAFQVGRRGWDKIKLDRFVDLVLNRIERHDTSLPHGRADPAGKAQAIGTAPRDFERGVKAGQGAQAIGRRDGSADGLVGLELEPPPGLRDVMNRYRHAPWTTWFPFIAAPHRSLPC